MSAKQMARCEESYQFDRLDVKWNWWKVRQIVIPKSKTCIPLNVFTEAEYVSLSVCLSHTFYGLKKTQLTIMASLNKIHMYCDLKGSHSHSRSIQSSIPVPKHIEVQISLHKGTVEKGLSILSDHSVMSMFGLPDEQEVSAIDP
ncbi:hypothetical protein Tco_0185717 [Tanacetum coccineum]